MSENQLNLRSINDLIEQKDQFYIPAYQRGYRWTKRQVEDLLNDVLEFHHKDKKQSEFYCLQPIVVRKVDDKWELIDGQQRLTTLFIILSYFNRRMAEEFRKTLFSIEYATRPSSQQFLENINVDEKDKNIDFYHMYEAFEKVKEWFKDKDNFAGNLESLFLNKVQVIWYDVQEDIDPIEVFTRLNIGKIPLTNAELVKALFLKSSNFGKDQTRISLRQVQIAQEWDDMERALQNDAFWYFLSNKDPYASRIELVLELVADELGTAAEIKNDPSYVFLAFYRWFNIDDEEHGNKSDAIDARWEYIQKYFLQLEEWYQDRHWFHLVGFLVNQGVSISDIKKRSNGAEDKQAFLENLKQRIMNEILPKQNLVSMSGDELEAAINDAISKWEYGGGSRYIRPALLLFNVASLLRNRFSNLRFQFDSYKKDDWDLEHIRSVRSEKPLRPDDQKTWLQGVVEHLTGMADATKQFEAIESLDVAIQELCRKALNVIETSPFNSEQFDEAYECILEYFKESDEGETDNSIANLALLDSSTNRSYGNAVFPIKRKRIIALDKSGAFVPLCTKNVFLKYYSNKVDNMMFWGSDDADDYRTAIIEMLTWFFNDRRGV